MSEGNLTDYTVTLRSREELDDFYTDMETEGGNITIPNRAVAVSLRKPISRNTRYWLTAEEAEQVKQDERVLDVVPTEWVGKYRPLQVRSGNWVRGGGQDANHDNWGLLAHTEDEYLFTQSIPWGSDGNEFEYAPDYFGGFDLPAYIHGTGKNVDVIIADGHIDPDHPEFDDGTGTSRVVQYNWFQHDIGSGTGTYTYGTGNGGDNHGAHVAGTAAGNRYGWATDANIYNIYVYGDANGNGDIGSDIWDYIREFHANKPINPNTGRKNPTIVNASFGAAPYDFATADFERITETTYRGVTTRDSAGLTYSQMVDGGIYPNNGPEIPVYNTAASTDVEDTIADGIIVVAAAGNESFRVADANDQDYANTYKFVYQGTEYIGYTHRGTVPGAVPGVICVGSLGAETVETKSSFSNTGSRIDVFAAGEFINSAINDTGDSTGAGAVPDSRNASYLVKKIQGTSMASPQVCGALACFLEHDPTISPQDARELIRRQARGFISDTGSDNVTDVRSLQGANNNLLMVKYSRSRAPSGSVFPKTTVRYRPDSGITFPRVKRRRKG